MVIGHPVQRGTKTFSRALESRVEKFQGKITHFKTHIMMLKQGVWIARDTILHENIKNEDLTGVCAESKAKLSSVEECLKSLSRQQEEYSWEFQSSPL